MSSLQSTYGECGCDRGNELPMLEQAEINTMNRTATILLWIALFLLSVLLLISGVQGVNGAEFHGVALSAGGPVLPAILAVFSLGALTNGVNTLLLLRQLPSLHRGVCCGKRPRDLQAGGLLGLHVQRLVHFAERSQGHTLSQAGVLATLRSTLYRREWLTRTCCSLLLTLGLVETVLRLTGSLEGLSQSMQAVVS